MKIRALLNEDSVRPLMSRRVIPSLSKSLLKVPVATGSHSAAISKQVSSIDAATQTESEAVFLLSILQYMLKVSSCPLVHELHFSHLKQG